MLLHLILGIQALHRAATHAARGLGGRRRDASERRAIFLGCPEFGMRLAMGCAHLLALGQLAREQSCIQFLFLCCGADALQRI